MTLALQTGTAGRVTIANYTQIIWAFIWGLVFLGEKPVLTSIFGTLLIAVDAAFAVYKAWIKKPRAKKGSNDNKPTWDTELDEIEVVDVTPTPELHEIGVSPSPDSSAHEHEHEHHAEVKESEPI